MSCWKQAAKAKIVHPEELSAKVDFLRLQNKSIATLNGSFDLLHAGHLHILYEASKQADVLIVALNSDASIRSYKGPKRPMICLEHRLEMIAALGFVSFVTWFEETTPCQILQKINPDVHVNGAEYGPNCIEASVVEKGGGRLHLVNRVPGLSTSDIITKIQEVCV